MITEQDKLKYKRLTKNKLSDCFHDAMKADNFEVVEYLLQNSSEMRMRFYKDMFYYLETACLWNKFETVQYFLTSPDLTYHPDIYDNHNKAFQNACSNLYETNNVPLLRFFIFEQNIHLDKDLKEYIKSYPDIEKMFELRTLNSSLTDELIQKSTQKKIKI